MDCSTCGATTRYSSPATSRCCKPKANTAIIEQVIADAATSALAHLPSRSFTANAAWALLWTIAHNLTRALGCLAGNFHARATTATIRAHLITVPARLARSARRIILHLPESWPWQPAWQALHVAVCRPPGHRTA